MQVGALLYSKSVLHYISDQEPQVVYFLRNLASLARTIGCSLETELTTAVGTQPLGSN